MTRAEHLAWAKERALAYLEAGDISEAVASMFSDMQKHKGSDEPGEDALADHPALALKSAAHMAMAGTAREVKEWIEGFR